MWCGEFRRRRGSDGSVVKLNVLPLVGWYLVPLELLGNVTGADGVVDEVHRDCELPAVEATVAVEVREVPDLSKMRSCQSSLDENSLARSTVQQSSLWFTAYKFLGVELCLLAEGPVVLVVLAETEGVPLLPAPTIGVIEPEMNEAKRERD